jgi:enoyl-CoA hydratase/carnithine racemase
MGFDLALACGSRILGPEGWCMQGWGRIGLVPGTGGELLLRSLNSGVLWRLLAEQPRIDGAQAEAWGLGEAAVSGTALELSLERMAKLGELPREVLMAYVSLSRSELRARLDQHLAACAEIQAHLMGDAALSHRVNSALGH